MPIFNDLYYNAPSSQYVKKPIQDFVNAASSINQTYDKNKAGFDALQMAKANISSPFDAHAKQQRDIYDQAYAQLQPYVDNNNFEDAAGAVSKTTLDVLNNPLLKHIDEEKQAYANFIKTGQEGIAKKDGEGKINRNDFLATKRIIDAQNKGEMRVDPETGEVTNKFTGAFIPVDPNAKKRVLDIIEKLKDTDLSAEAIKQKIPGYINTSTASGRSKQNLEEVAWDIVNSDQDIKDYYAWKANTASTLLRLDDETGAVRDYQVGDLVQTGVIDVNGNVLMEDNPKTKIDEKIEWQKALFPDGKTLDQNAADNLFKNNLVNKDISGLIKLAGDLNHIKIDKSFQQDLQWKFNTDKQLLKYKQDLEDASKESERYSDYFSKFSQTPGTSFVVQPAEGNAILGGSTGTRSTSLARSEAPVNLQDRLGKNVNPVVVANIKKIKDLNEQLLGIKKTLEGYSSKNLNRKVIGEMFGFKNYEKASYNELKTKMKDLRTEIHNTAIELEKIDPSKQFGTKSQGFNSVVAQAREYAANYRFPVAETDKDFYKTLSTWSDRQEKLMSLGDAPIQIGNQSGGSNGRIDENGEAIFDVEYIVSGNSAKGVGKLNSDEVAEMVKEGELVELTAAGKNKDGDVTKFPTYKWITKAHITPTVQGDLDYNRKLKEKGNTYEGTVQQEQVYQQTLKTNKLIEKAISEGYAEVPMTTRSGQTMNVLEVLNALKTKGNTEDPNSVNDELIRIENLLNNK